MNETSALQPDVGWHSHVRRRVGASRCMVPVLTSPQRRFTSAIRQFAIRGLAGAGDALQNKAPPCGGFLISHVEEERELR